MARPTPAHLIPAACAAADQTKEMRFPALVLPGCGCLILDRGAGAAAELPVMESAAHGGRVSKGDLLVRLDGKTLEVRLVESRRLAAEAEPVVSRLEMELEALRESSARRLDSLRRAAENAAEAEAVFTLSRRAAAETSAVESLRYSRDILTSHRQELARLAKWQDAAGPSGGAGEILLENHEDDMAAAEFSLRMEMLNHRRVLDVLLPRETQALIEATRGTAAVLRKEGAEIPVLLEMKKLALDSLQTDLAQTLRTLAELEAARARLEARAPADGCC